MLNFAVIIADIAQRFEDDADCLALLESVRWNGSPTCPYCYSSRHSKTKQRIRYHCNNCYTFYSVVVQTMFHNTHLPLQKWFVAIYLITSRTDSIPVRELAQQVQINKDTAWRLKKRIDISLRSNDSAEFIKHIIEEIMR